MKERILFPVSKTNDIISKAKNAGHLGIRVDKNLKKKMPDFVGQGDFPSTYNLKSKKRKDKKSGSLLSRTKYEQTKHKESQIDIAGYEAGKVDDFNFRGKGALKYNPFANSAGEISQTGGYNKGGDEEFQHKKDKDEIINPRFKLGRKNRKSHLPQTIRQPNPFPNILNPDGQLKKSSGFIIKSKKSRNFC